MVVTSMEADPRWQRYRSSQISKFQVELAASLLAQVLMLRTPSAREPANAVRTLGMVMTMSTYFVFRSAGFTI